MPKGQDNVSQLFGRDTFKLSADLSAAFKKAQAEEVAKHGTQDAYVGRENHPEVMDQFLKEFAQNL